MCIEQTRESSRKWESKHQMVSINHKGTILELEPTGETVPDEPNVGRYRTLGNLNRTLTVLLCDKLPVARSCIQMLADISSTSNPRQLCVCRVPNSPEATVF